MLVKCATTKLNLSASFPAVYFIFGGEPFQLNSIASQIKASWEGVNESDHMIMSINNENDWTDVSQETNSYSLFNTSTLIDIRYEKTSLDAKGKEFLTTYLAATNSACLVLIRAPLVNLKSIQSFANQQNITLIQLVKMDSRAVSQWILTRLKQISPQFDPAIIELIQQFTQGNLYATAQFLDKIELMHEPQQPLTLTQVKEQLIVQCDYSLFELGEALLLGNSAKALHLLYQAKFNKTEPTLVLWMFTQEIRLLLQLLEPHQGSNSFREKAERLKIWSSKLALYQKAVNRLNLSQLTALLKHCNTLDFQLKTSDNKQLWPQFDCLALSICNGSLVNIDE